jgi:hypothetical protein
MPLPVPSSPIEPLPARTASSTPGQPQRFTLDGSAELEAQLAAIGEEVLTAIRRIVPERKLEAVMLGGGYGRGEGGVLKTEAGDEPYNDLEFYICARGNRLRNERRYRGLLGNQAEELSRAAGVEVEFKITSLAHLRQCPVSMFSYDLIMGHRWLRGDDRLLQGCDHHREADRIPLSEATRLLMNRGSGLLFARQRLQRQPFTADDADFAGRNLAKAQLAFGDAVLAAMGQYHWSCPRRHARLQALTATDNPPWLDEVRRHHACGVEFKLHPRSTHPSAATLQTRHAELTGLGLRIWLWLESRRLGYPFKSAGDYALSHLNKCPETNPWRNRLVNARLFGPAVFPQAKAERNPREGLLNALTLLLWGPLRLDFELTRCLQRELRTSSLSQAGLVNSYQALWKRLN